MRTRQVCDHFGVSAFKEAISYNLMSVLRARREISIEEFPYGQYTVGSLSFDLNVQFLCEILCECTAYYRGRVSWG